MKNLTEKQLKFISKISQLYDDPKVATDKMLKAHQANNSVFSGNFSTESFFEKQLLEHSKRENQGIPHTVTILEVYLEETSQPNSRVTGKATPGFDFLQWQERQGVKGLS